MYRRQGTVFLIPIAVVMVSLLGACSHAPKPADRGPFPEISGWTATQPLTYNRTNLHEYIDGAAELFYQYGLVKATAAEYVRTGDSASITAEIYEMDSSENAFGIFSYESRGMFLSPIAIGQRAAFSRGYLNFWKGTRYVKVYPTYSDEILEPIVLELGRHISEAITGEGKLPAIVALLPEDGLDSRSLCFVPAGGPAAELDMPEGVSVPEGFMSVVVAEYSLRENVSMRVMLAEMPEASKSPEMAVEEVDSGKGLFRGKFTQGRFIGWVGNAGSNPVKAIVDKLMQRVSSAK